MRIWKEKVEFLAWSKRGLFEALCLEEARRGALALLREPKVYRGYSGNGGKTLLLYP